MTTTGFQPAGTERQGDRALDEWLAEHLLGWPLERVRHQTFHADTHTLVPSFTLLDRLAFSHLLPALERRGWTWRLSGSVGGTIVCTLYYGRGNGIRHALGCDATTVALAVAAAARRAVEWEARPAVEYPIAEEHVGAYIDRG